MGELASLKAGRREITKTMPNTQGSDSNPRKQRVEWNDGAFAEKAQERKYRGPRLCVETGREVAEGHVLVGSRTANCRQETSCGQSSKRSV